MPDDYKDFQREPSKSHQCMHHSEDDGTRCRAMSMQNNYMCYAHRTDDILTVVENDMFLIDALDTHEAIQKAFLDVAARLACNHIDLKRAELLITLLRAASRNLRDAATARRQALRDAAATAAFAGTAPTANTNDAVILSAAKNPRIQPEAPQRCADRIVPASGYPEDSSSGLSSPAEEGLLTPGVEPTPPERIYTAEERRFLNRTTTITDYWPAHHVRPESITDDDIVAAIHANRRSLGFRPIELRPDWDKTPLPASNAVTLT